MLTRLGLRVGRQAEAILLVVLGAWAGAVPAASCLADGNCQIQPAIRVVSLAEAADKWEAGPYREFTPRTTGSPVPEGTGTRSLTPKLKLSSSVVQRPRLTPGEIARLRAEYEVTAPTGTVEVKETRIIRFEGQQVAKLEKLAPRASGPVGSEQELKVPRDAAPGWYKVTTIVEPAPVISRTIAVEQQANSMFLVESRSPAETLRLDEDQVRIKVWAEKSGYKVGDIMKLFFETSRNGYVTLVDVGTSGRVSILYPNRFSPSQQVKGGTTYSLPGAGEQYELRLNGPAGVELVYALVTSTPTKFAEANFAQMVPSVNLMADVFTRDINLIVKKIPLKERANAILEIDVKP